MPSLRRFPSSPTVRHAPYSSASARVRRCRRSAPSETSGRRVLADIAWWTVTDGQRGPNAADTDSVPFDENSIGGGSPIHAGVQHPLSLVQLPWVSAASEEAPETALPTARFAALAIIPGISHRRDSSVDSGSGLSDNLFEDVPSRLDMGFFDSPLSPLPQLRRSPSRTLVPALARSLTLVDTYALRVELPSHYADFSISPLSSTPDFLN